MSCPTCGRKAVAGECEGGYMPYLSGDYPCPFNPDLTAAPKNLKVLPPLQVVKRDDPAPEVRDSSSEVMSSEGLEDLL